jgi:polyhydroxyalkanoate synthesis regulator phasin
MGCVTVTDEGRKLLAETIRRGRKLDGELIEQLPPELAEAFSTATRRLARHTASEATRHPREALTRFIEACARR